MCDAAVSDQPRPPPPRTHLAVVGRKSLIELAEAVASYVVCRRHGKAACKAGAGVRECGWSGGRDGRRVDARHTAGWALHAKARASRPTRAPRTALAHPQNAGSAEETVSTRRRRRRAETPALPCTAKTSSRVQRQRPQPAREARQRMGKCAVRQQGGCCRHHRRFHMQWHGAITGGEGIRARRRGWKVLGNEWERLHWRRMPPAASIRPPQ